MPRLLRLGLLSAVLLLPAAAPASAAELRIGYRALEKLMVAGGFDEEGRFYPQPALASKCRYAYFQDPVVSAAQGRLLVTVSFHTMLGIDLGGACRGAADAFPAVISGVPVYRDGELRLDQVRIDTEGRGYGEAVRPLVDSLLKEGLKFPLLERLEEASRLVWEKTGARMSVPTLEIGEIRLGASELAVAFDFRVDLR